MSYIGNPITTAAFVTDQFSGNGSTTSFTMSVAPAGTTSMLVAITGVLQDPSTYSVVGTTLTFSAAPPTGTGNISVRYMGIPASGVATTAYRTVTEFTATAGQTTFSVPSYTVGYINVYDNGVRQGAADYTASNGTTVVLASAAAAGDLITVESFYVSSVLNAIPATSGAVQTAYIADSNVTTAKIADANVTQSKFAANVAGNGPAFSAYLASNQTIAHNTNTKVTINTKEFDTASCFDTSTYRFTPNVAGYYQINVAGYLVGTGVNGYVQVYIFKNGSAIKTTLFPYTSNNGIGGVSLSTVVSMNGTTDYVEFYIYQVTGASQPLIGGQPSTTFSGALVRAA